MKTYFFPKSKDNYFFDYYNYVNNRLGMTPSLIFESHNSIIQKVIYQIENGDKKHKHLYIKSYLDNELLRDDFVKQFDFWKTLETCLKGYKEDNVFFEEKENLENLKGIQKDIEREMLDKIVEALISYLSCGHEIDEHYEAVNYCVKLLIVEYRYRGYTKNEIEKFMERWTRTPNWETQLMKPFVNPKMCSFSFFIFELAVDKNFRFTYDGILFQAMKQGMFSKEFEYIPELEVPDVIASIELACLSQESAEVIALDKVSNALNFINSKIRRAGILKTELVIQGNGFREKKKIINCSHIGVSDMDELDDNSYKILAGVSSDLKVPFLYFEADYLNAYRLNDIPKLWQYLENIIPLGDSGKQVKSIVSGVLAKEHFNWSNEQNLRVFLEVVGSLVLRGEIERNDFLMFQRKERAGNVEIGTTNCFSNSFLEQLRRIDMHEKNMIPIEFYKGLLQEAYELRNMIVHGKGRNQLLHIKVSENLRGIIKRFRDLLINKMKNSSAINYKNFMKIVENNEV